MTVRSQRFLLLAFPTVVVFGLASWLLWPRSMINRENFDRIQLGMPLAEVEVILGGPERNESASFTIDDWKEAFSREDGDGLSDPERLEARYEQFMSLTCISGRSLTWISNESMILVSLGANKCVVHKSHIPVQASGSPLAMVRRWLGL